MTYYDQVSEAAAFLRSKLGSLNPSVAIVLGSGLGAVADAVASPVVVPCAQIPHFPQFHCRGHSGRFVAGLMGGAPVVVLQGRVHFYEGYTPEQVTFPMRVLGALGLQSVILTNAAGGIQEGYRVGQLVALSDHINLMGWNPLIGPNEPRFAARPDTGLRFTDMTEAYSKALRALAKKRQLKRDSILPRESISPSADPATKPPPRFAPSARWRNAGRHVHRPETIVACHMGLEVLAISCVTNLAAGWALRPSATRKSSRQATRSSTGWLGC